MGKKKPGAARHVVRAARRQVVAPPPGGTLDAKLVTWALRTFDREHGKITPRLGIARERAFDVYDAEQVAGRMGPEGLAQALAVLARTAEPDELVFSFSRTLLANMDPAQIPARSGASLYARSPAGARIVRAFALRRFDRQNVQLVEIVPEKTSFDAYGDFAAPGYFVDPLVDERLAKMGFPGAVVQLHAPSLLALSRSAQPVASPSTVVELPGPKRQLAIPVVSWEATRRNPTTAPQLCVPRLMPTLVTFVPGAAPMLHLDRSLDELLSRRWVSEAQAATIIERLGSEADIGHALDLLLAAPVSETMKAFWCAAACTATAKRDDEPLCRRAHAELSARLSTAAAAAGGVEALLESTWHVEEVRNPLGAALLSAVVIEACYRINLTLASRDDTKRRPDLIEGFAHARRVRDWLLDRAGAPSGEAGGRVAALCAELASSAAMTMGGNRDERLLAVAVARVQKVPPWESARDYAIYQAMTLHSVVVLAELLEAYESCGLAELGHGDIARRDYRPEEVAPDGLTTVAIDMLGHHLRLRAAVLCEIGDPRHTAALERAHAIDPRDLTTLGCFDEARFRAGDRGEALLRDLHQELRAAPTLGAAAELLAVADALGHGKSARKAREKVAMLAARGPHAWMAEVRLARARPAALADAHRVERLIAAAPAGPFDADERAVFALYGAKPAEAVAEALRDLQVRREALEWGALVAEVALEETSRRSRPEEQGKAKRPAPPREAGPGAAALALEALRARLDTRAVSRSPLKEALEAHARRAAQIASADGGFEPWLAALASEEGLVSALDGFLATPTIVPAVARALELADAALDQVLDLAWQKERQHALASAWPSLASRGEAGGELRKQYAALTSAIGDAREATARACVERDITNFLAAIQAPALAEIRPEPIAPADPDVDFAEDDDFAEMRLAADALERSRRDLDTPEWALQEGLRQVSYYNLARGKRDLKMLRGTRDAAGPLWELRHRDARHPVRVLYRFDASGPVALAILAKQDDAHQRRMLVRIAGWRQR